MYSGDLNSKLVRIQIMRICLLVEWFIIQIPGTMAVQFSDPHLVKEPVFRPPFEYPYTIQIPTVRCIITQHVSYNLTFKISTFNLFVPGQSVLQVVLQNI